MSGNPFGPRELLERLGAHLDAPRILVGYSGGADSAALTHALAHAGLDRPIRAVHIHHGLDPSADAWADLCRRNCAAWGVPFALERVRVDSGNGGREAAARAARYAAFEQMLDTDECLLLAHHRDDQAETVLMQLLRGSGVDGLRAMPAERRLGRGWLLRPVLDWPRSTLADYVAAHGIEHVTDPDNLDPTRERAWLRSAVLPVLTERRPGVIQTLARVADNLAEAATVITQAAERALAECRDADTLRVEPLAGLDAALRHAVIRHWLAQQRLPTPDRERLQQIDAAVCQVPKCGWARVDWNDTGVAIWRGRVFAIARRVGEPFALEWDTRDPLPLPGGRRLELRSSPDGEIDPALIRQGRLHVRSARGGEHIELAGRGSRSVRHVLAAAGVAPWLRDAVPLVFVGKRLALVGDVATAAAFQKKSAQQTGLTLRIEAA